MRKAWFLGLLAATVAMPAPALAQDDAQAAREQRRQERQEQRAQRQQQRQAQPPAQVAAPAAQQAQQPRRDRAERREQRQEARQERRAQPGQPAQARLGNSNEPRMEAYRRRYEQLDRRNARQPGTAEQYRELVGQQGSRREARQERREVRQDRREDRREVRQDRREDRRDWRQDRREFRQDARQWNRDWQRDRRYDWRGHRNYNRQIFRARPYYAPYRGYSYNRFSIGVILDRLLWGQNYWISDPWQYRLPPAPYGYQWVRYYNDVLLVDTYTGRVVDVIHDFFW